MTIRAKYANILFVNAAVVELADATDSKSVGVKSVSVRPRSAALQLYNSKNRSITAVFCFQSGDINVKLRTKSNAREVVMIYTELTKKAMRIAYEGHKNQVDKSGLPYIYHPIHLAEQMKDETEVCVALLHDVAEDTDITSEDLRREGFGEEIIEALKLMTHNKNVPYMEYIRRIKDNPTARTVKLADLAHNSDLSRLDIVDEKDLERAEKYKRAMEILGEIN